MGNRGEALGLLVLVVSPYIHLVSGEPGKLISMEHRRRMGFRCHEQGLSFAHRAFYRYR